VLFDEKVLDFIDAHFVFAITDHPRGPTEPKRNPELWQKTEEWKDSKNNGQLVWLVSADESRRAGLHYSTVKKPEVLLGWMQLTAVFDGRIEKPSPEQQHEAVLLHLRSELRSAYPRTDRKLRQLSARFDQVCAIPEARLCAKQAAPALLERLRKPSAERRAQLRAITARLLAIGSEVERSDGDWLTPLAKAHAEDAIGGEAAYIGLAAVLQVWLDKQLASGALAETEDLRAELTRLAAQARAVGGA